ncbi:gliding motility-associated C-terminal domain-containing protein [Foetidibacter luteolus]|uniref:gliding motility-associated C-terminal domain-containing protein n=1 Tax=Foetidibacter luteolus TaxID=2608880 RepID=UPI00129B8846|nr:gliding motility-associated C-terminal domain-containing protein [Foetidibacter luteolus]
MTLKYLTILLLLLPVTLLAETFTVNTNADSGPGSLRAALQNAQANGTGNTDSIVFAILNYSLPGRTITLQSPLPDVSANLVIDGTTQTGLAFELSGAKVKLQPGANYPASGTMFNLTAGNSNIEVYGIYLKGNSPSHTALLTNGVLLNNATNIKIGSLTGGNVISGFATGIGFTGSTSSNIDITGNVIGLNEKTTINSDNETTQIAINAENVLNITVASNVLYGTTNAFRFNSNVKGVTSYLNFTGNRVGTDIFGYTLPSYPATRPTNLVYISGNGTNGQYDSAAVFTLYIRSNTVTGNAVNGFYIGDGLASTDFSFITNSVGVDVTNNRSAYTFVRGIYVGFTGRPWGSSTLPPGRFTGNKIFFCTEAGLVQEQCYLYVNDNSFYCNTEGIKSLPTNDNVITITNVTENTIEGTCAPVDNLRIDLYTVRDCSGSACQGYAKIASFLKKGTGNTWSYCGYIQGKVVAVSSYAGTSFYSSNFSNCIQAPSKPVVTQASCKRPTGSIRGVVIPANSTITWINSQGAEVGNTPDLLNVAPEKYVYEVKSPDCSYKSDTFEIRITGIPNINTNRVKIFPEVCGSDGAILYILSNETDSLKWINDVGDTVLVGSTTLENQPSGRYKLRAGKDQDCAIETDWFTIPDERTRVDNNAISITPATCSRNNGIVTYTSTFPADYLFWWSNSSNTPRDTNNYTIDSLPMGGYRLHIQRVTYDSSCTTSFGPYSVTRIPALSFDISNAAIGNASCSNSNGSITNITVSNAVGNVAYVWADSTGKTVGTGLNLSNVPAGRYFLKGKDESSCDTVRTAYFTLLNEGVITIDSSNMVVKPASCLGPDGGIENITATGADIYQWINTGSQAAEGNSGNLQNVAPGSYQLVLNNSFGCETRSYAITVPQAVFDTITVLSVDQSDAHCNEANGSINILQYDKDASLYSFEWIDNGSNTIVGRTNQISGLDSSSYSYYATDTNGCRGNIFTASIIQTGQPTLNETGAVVKNDSCSLSKGSVTGITVQGGGAQYTYQWVNAATQQTASPYASLTNVPAGNYYLIAKDQFNCTVQGSAFTVNNTDAVLPLPDVREVNIVRGSTATIRVNNAVGGVYGLYSTPASSAPLNTSAAGILQTPVLQTDAVFYVRLQSGSCYSEFASVKVNVFDKSALLAPNVFSPNGDGINDTWVIKQVGFVTIQSIIIFNRYGQQVHTMRDLNIPWNGTSNGKPLPVGTYYYVIQAKDIHEKPIKQTGYVAILK